ALLAGSACTRFGIFAAGVASAEDPQYTVAPHRAATAASGEGHQPAPAAHDTR
ncbi:polysulfide reductase, partial [Streptomyces sp. NPDC048279]